MLPKQSGEILTSYISDRVFRVKHGNEYSDQEEIRGPQGSVLGSIPYLLYTSNIPRLGGTAAAKFANDTALLIVEKDQDLYNWTKPKKIKL